jgi:hypothetical protein
MTPLDRAHLTAFRAACRVNPFVCTFHGGDEMTGMKTRRDPSATIAQPNTGDQAPEVITLALADLGETLPAQGELLKTSTHAYRIAAIQPPKGPLISYDVDPAVTLP